MVDCLIVEVKCLMRDFSSVNPEAAHPLESGPSRKTKQRWGT